MSVSELEAVVRLARAATAHTSHGQSVCEATTQGDLFVLRMASWSVAREAITVLAVAGLDARLMAPDGGHPRIEVRRADPDPVDQALDRLGVRPSDRPALRDHAEVIDLSDAEKGLLDPHRRLRRES